MRHLHRIIEAFTILVCVGAVALNAQTDDAKAFVSNVVAVAATKSNGNVERGTGILVGGDTANGYILTALHNVAGADRITVRFNDGSDILAKPFRDDTSLDAAVVLVPAREVPPEVRVLRYASASEVGLNSTVTIYGHPGQEWTAWRGVIANTSHYLNASRFSVQHSEALLRGFSGGPVVSDARRLVGLFVSIERPYGVVVKSDDLARWLDLVARVPTNYLAFEPAESSPPFWDEVEWENSGPGGSIEGRLLNQRDGSPIAGLSVRLREADADWDSHALATATSDADGRFRINVKPGGYTLTIDGDGWGHRELRGVAISPRFALRLTESLEKRGINETITSRVEYPGKSGSIGGTVTDAAGRPVVALIVATDMSGGVAEASVNSTSSGRFSFASIPGGVYELSFTADGFRTRRVVRVPVTQGYRAVVDARLDATRAK